MFVAIAKMVKTRRALGSMSSEVNVGGEEVLRRRVERTPVERHTIQMYERREEAWRPLNKDRVAAFLRLFVLCFVETENGRPLQAVTYRMMKKCLVKRIIPWMQNRLVWTTIERYWPMTLPQFRELDQYLADHMPRVHKGDDWGGPQLFF